MPGPNDRAAQLMQAQGSSGVQMPPKAPVNTPPMPAPQNAQGQKFPMPQSPLRNRAEAVQAAEPGPGPGTPQGGRTLTSQVSAAREHANMQAPGNEEATAEEQAEYERVITAVDAAVYGDDNLNRSILNGILPEDKISSMAQTSALLLKQLDEKLDMDEVVIPQVTMDIVDRVVDIAENGKGLQVSDSEVQAILGSTWEMVMAAYGPDPDAYAEFTQGMSEEDLAGYEQQYYEFLQGAGK